MDYYERERERQGRGGVSPLRQWTPSLPAMHPDSLIRGAQPKMKEVIFSQSQENEEDPLLSTDYR